MQYTETQKSKEGEEGEEDISDWKLSLGFLSETRD